MLLEVGEWVFMDISMTNELFLPMWVEITNESGSFLFPWRDGHQSNSSCRQI